MSNSLQTPWVTLEVNNIPLALCNDLGRPNLRMITWSRFIYYYYFFFNNLLAFLSPGGKATHPVKVSIMTNRYLYP